MFGKNSKVDAVASSVMQVIEKVTTDTTKGREEGSINSYTPAKVTLKGDVEKKPEGKKPEETTARKSIEAKSVSEELKGNQDKLDKNHNGKLDAQDFKMLRGKKKTNEAFIQKLKAGAKKVLAKVGGGSDEDMKKDLQRKMGIPQTGKVGMAKQNEEVDALTEGKMDAMSLSHLWHAHAKHSYGADQGYGGGQGGHHSDHAATAIENHVRKHHGNKVADDMVKHSDLHVAHAEYVGGKEAKEVEQDATKLRTKHKIQGDLYGNHEHMNEGWDDMLKSVADKKKPQPNGGSGIKKGKSYGNQKPEPEKEVKEGYEDSAEDKAEDKKEAKKRHMTMKQWEKSTEDKKQDMKEGKEDVPFDPPYKEKKETVTDKSGAKHTPMSRAKNLARAAMDKIKKDHKLG